MAMLFGCGEVEAPPQRREPEPAPAAEPAEPPPIPMGWSAEADPGVRYAMPPGWIRVEHISPTMVFSWQGPESPLGRATFHLDRRAHVDVATPARMGEVLARQLAARGATEVANRVVADFRGAEWAEVECVLQPAGAPNAARMLTRARVRPDGVSISSGCSGPEPQAENVIATCRRLFEMLDVE